MSIRQFMNIVEAAQPGTGLVPAKAPVTALSHDVHPTDIKDLPAVIGDALHAEGTAVHMRWKQVKNLPNYQFREGIRQMGRQIFGAFTTTSVDDIQVMSSFDNSKAELSTMTEWLRRNGTHADSAELHFHDIMPGYRAAVEIINALGYQFMLVKDAHGMYVYAWKGHDLPAPAAPAVAGPLPALGDASIDHDDENF